MIRKLFVLSLIFMCLVITSAYFCVTYTEYKWIIFYTVSAPSLLGVGACSFLMAVFSMNNDERKPR